MESLLDPGILSAPNEQVSRSCFMGNYRNNPYLRMTKEHYGRDCKVCLKPFTIFRWCPGPKMRFRRTEICSTCAKLKNLCQSCMLDLQYGLPAQVRDTVLGITENVPKNEANREFYIATNRKRLERGDISLVDYETAASPQARTSLEKLSRKNPHYEQNLTAPCSFYAKGKCTRGDTCPYRHTLVAERYPSLQSYRDRYYGENDPAAKKIFDANPQLISNPQSSRNQGKSNKGQLLIKGLSNSTNLEDIKEFFKQYGQVETVEITDNGQSAIVKFGIGVDFSGILSRIGQSIIINETKLSVIAGVLERK